MVENTRRRRSSSGAVRRRRSTSRPRSVIVEKRFARIQEPRSSLASYVTSAVATVLSILSKIDDALEWLLLKCLWPLADFAIRTILAGLVLSMLLSFTTMGKENIQCSKQPPVSNPMEILLNDSLGLGIVADTNRLSDRIHLAQNESNHSATQMYHFIAELETFEAALPRKNEVLGFAYEWQEKHTSSDLLFNTLLDKDTLYGEAVVTDAHALVLSIDNLDPSIIVSEPYDRFCSWLPQAFRQTFAGKLVHGVEDFALDHIQQADSAVKSISSLRNALQQEAEVRGSLVILLSVVSDPWKEAGFDIDQFEYFLQHGSRLWLTHARDVARGMKMQYGQLRNRYGNNIEGLRDATRCQASRDALIKALNIDRAGVVSSLRSADV